MAAIESVATLASVPRDVRPPFVWGKRDREAAGPTVRTQSLAAHSRDVASIFAALTHSPVIRDRLAHLAGVRQLPNEVCDRLAYLVFLHDVGKCNAGFQARWAPTAPLVGHISPLAAVIGDNADVQLAASFLEALNASALATWGSAVEPLLHAIVSHHGRPWPRDVRREQDARHWRRVEGYDPLDAVRGLRQAADEQFPGAIAGGRALLPHNQDFIHAVAGLTQLADWIASSDWLRDSELETPEDWADRRTREIGFKPPAALVGWRDTATAACFETLFGRTPHEHQRVAAEESGRLVILESETGSGKTEAALLRFARLYARGEVGGLYFALPTRTAAASLHERVELFARALWGRSAPPVVLAVPGYVNRAADGDGGALPDAPDPLDAPEGDVRSASPWAAEHPKRFFAATISVGTVDQALLAAIRVKHAHLRGAALMRHLLVVDEVHASDAYMRRILVRLLRDHLASGGHALLLSATLGAEARHELLEASLGARVRDIAAPTLKESVATAYPLVSTAMPRRATSVRGADRQKRVSVDVREWLDDPGAVARCALEAADAGAKVLIIRNTVAGAIDAQRALEDAAGPAHDALFRVRGVVTLHHGRFAREDRRLLDAGIERCFGGSRRAAGVIAIGTQTLEQSLDIDADLLISDLCPADVLLQRLGRLHRHDRAAHLRGRCHRPRVIVMTPSDGLSEFVRPRRPGGRRRHGLGFRLHGGAPVGVYRNVVILEATRRMLVEHPEWEIPTMNRVLVERAMHSESLDALLSALPAEEREQWQAHYQRVAGDTLAAGVQADDGLLRRDRDLMTEPNNRFDDSLATRLGVNDVLLDLPPETVGPLSERISRVAVPSWMLGTADVENNAVMTAARPGDGPSCCLALTVDGVTLVYDRLGLRVDKDGDS